MRAVGNDLLCFGCTHGVRGTRISRYIVSKREGSELSGHNMHAVVVPVTPPPEEEALICTVAVHDMIGTKKREGW
jgi:hypothetical protein